MLAWIGEVLVIVGVAAMVGTGAAVRTLCRDAPAKFESRGCIAFRRRCPYLSPIFEDYRSARENGDLIKNCDLFSAMASIVVKRALS